ncbi:MAG TPA: DUF6567 family protein [Bacteroidota bacterium]|nr:DUF6567 family protein [Bacteroidota bacterium]
MKLTITFVAAFLLLGALVLWGCSTAGVFTAGNITDVQLQKGDFKIVARGVSGESSAGYLFGISTPFGMAANTVAVARIEGTGMLYKEALDNLWKNFETTHGSAEGRKLALVNVHYDSDALNLGVYARAKVMISADVVEFGE